MLIFTMMLGNLLQLSRSCLSNDISEVFHFFNLPLPNHPEIIGISGIFRNAKTQIGLLDVVLYAACTLDSNLLTSRQAGFGMDQYDWGACNPTTWRKDVVIPILESLGLSYYNPQVDVWSPELIKLEKNAKFSSDILLFVFENWKTRGLVSLLEVIYLASQRKPLVVTVSKFEDTGPLLIAGESIDKLEYYYLEEAMNYFLQTIKRLRIPCFSDVETAVNHAVRNSHLRFKSSGNLTHEEKKSIDKIQYVSRVLRRIIGTIPKSADSQFVYEQVRQGFQSLNIELTDDRDFVKYWNKADRLDLLYSLYAEHVLNRKSPALLSNFNVYLTSKLLNNSETSESCLSNKRLVKSGESNSLIDLMESQFDERLLYSFSQPDTSSHGDSRCASIKSSTCSSSSLPPLKKPDLNNTRNTVDLKTDIYIAGISEENKHSQFLWDNRIMPKLAKVNLSHYRAIEKTVCPSIGNNEDFLNCHEDLESKQLEIRQNSKLLLYIIDNNSFHLVTMLEAVYSMGCHLPVVLFVQMFNSSSSGCEIPLGNSKPNSLHKFISSDFKTRQLPMKSLIDMKIKSSTTSSSSSSSGASSDFTGTNSSLSEEELSQRSSSLEFGIIPDIYQSTKRSSNTMNCSNVKSSEILSFQANAVQHMNNNTHSSSANIITVHNSSISLSQQAVNDYNRVRMYLIDLAEELNIPVFYDIETAINFCIHKLTT